MILEAALLQVKSSMENEFEKAFEEASTIITAMNGYKSHELQRCLEVKGKYLLLVRWDTLEDHTIGFRQSSEYQRWKKLLHHFYSVFIGKGGMYCFNVVLGTLKLMRKR